MTSVRPHRAPFEIRTLLRFAARLDLGEYRCKKLKICQKKANVAATSQY